MAFSYGLTGASILVRGRQASSMELGLTFRKMAPQSRVSGRMGAKSGGLENRMDRTTSKMIFNDSIALRNSKNIKFIKFLVII